MRTSDDPKFAHVICFSGGESSAIAAIEAARRYGSERVILLNHDINPSVEDADVKRFKNEVADHLNIPITYANHPEWDSLDQFDVCVRAKAFKTKSVPALCTSRLKTEPFMKWVAENAPAGTDFIFHYGFDAHEPDRVQRRIGVMSGLGLRTEYPLALWSEKDRTIHAVSEIGITRPNTYCNFKHANCKGCLKAGAQHWYITFCERPDIFEKGKWAEDKIGYTIMKKASLEEIEGMFRDMQSAGIIGTEHEDPRTFFARVRKILGESASSEIQCNDNDGKPCECTF